MKFFMGLLVFTTLRVALTWASGEIEESSALLRQEKQNQQAYDQKMLLKQGELEIEKMRLKEKNKNEARLNR